MAMESAAAAAWSPFITVAAVAALLLLLLRLGEWARREVALQLERRARRRTRRKHLAKRTAPRPETDHRMPPQRSLGSSRGVFRSFPAVTDETHRRLMSEVEVGTANSAGRYYADIVKRHEEHARRTGGICPSPPRCPGTPLMIDEEDGDPGHPESAAESQH